MSQKKQLFTLLFSIIAATSAQAVVEYVPLQERSQGQSLTGGNVLNDSIFSNPAGSTFTQVYSLDASMQSIRDFAVSILDTKNGGVGGGLAYFRRSVSENAPVTQGGRVNMVTRISDQVGMGFSGKLVSGFDLAGKEARLTDIDGGLLANFNFMQMGLTLRNIFGGNPLMDMTREVVLGARINYQNQLFLSTAATSRSGFKPTQVGFGGEFVSPYYFALKGGYYFLPNTPFASWTGGLSFNSPKLSLHYAVEFPNQKRPLEHQLGVSLLL